MRPKIVERMRKAADSNEPGAKTKAYIKINRNTIKEKDFTKGEVRRSYS